MDKLELDVKYVNKRQIDAALKVLVDNGVEADEAPTVLQALGYALLNRELGEILGLID